MKLLFLTQVIDREDAVLGFVSRWVRGLAALCERVRVVALEVGDTSDLPANVDVRVIGRRGRVRRYLRYRRVLREALRSDGFDTVLAHMVPRYALVAAGPARRAGAGLYLWYTTAGVDARLRRAVSLVDKVFTASPESLRVETDRRVVTGHGVDIEHFGPDAGPADEPSRLMSVGRLTPAKDPLTILDALALLAERGLEPHLDLVGAARLETDSDYQARVEGKIREHGLQERVHLLGNVPYVAIPRRYRRATVVINCSHTGSLDKVTLEAMASRRPVVSCNDSSPGLFASLGADAERLLFEKHDAAGLAARLEGLLRQDPADRDALGERLRTIVATDHELDTLLARLVREMGGDA